MMQLYPKRLTGVEALKREKLLLKYAARHTGSDGWFDFNHPGASKSGADHASAGIMGSMISALGSKSAFNAILAIAPPIFTMVTKNRKKKNNNFMEKAVKEVLFGYVKWKAIQITFRGIMLIVNSRKYDHEAHQPGNKKRH